MNTHSEAHSNMEIRVKAATEYLSLFYLPIKQETKKARKAEGDLCKSLQAPTSTPEAYLLRAQGHASESEG